MNRGLPWTIHPNGIASILDHNDFYSFPNGRIKDYTAFVGILDLPIYILGCKTKTRNICYSHCRFQTGRDILTGIPCSLIDLLSAIHQPNIVARLLAWPGYEGTITEKLIWASVQHAAVIVAMQLHHRTDLDGTQLRYLIELPRDQEMSLATKCPRTSRLCSFLSSLLGLKHDI